MAEFDDVKQNKRLSEIRGKEEEAFVERVSGRFGLPYIDLAGVNIETDALKVIPEHEARSAQIAGFKLLGKDFYVAVKSPNLPLTKQVLEKLEAEYTLGVHMVSVRSLEKAWSRYKDISQAKETQGGMLDISSTRLEKLSNEIKTYKDIQRYMDEILASDDKKKTTQLMEVMFAGAISTKSSDVHIEIQEEVVRVRYRQDGVLVDVANVDHQTYKTLLSRIKLLSEMKLTQTEQAQDGRFTIDYSGKEIEVRVSVIPSSYGESFVMRILNPDGINVGIETLGIEPKLYEILLKEIQKPNGMILTTGPTGSGKTTTLYSFLRKVYNPEVKILTIEDPIEYHLSGISQTQVNHEKDYDFSSGLRAALRQDPDIIMVGEIRDKETASVAVNASLTGHLVLSTLHTNSAAGVIPRLIDLGISPQILAAALSVSLAQRLVRKICKHCKQKVEVTEDQKQIVKDILEEAESQKKDIGSYGMSLDQDIIFYKGSGCDQCNETGFRGRIGIFEAIITDEVIEELLNQRPSEQDVRRAAQTQGLLNMREDGLVKILNGTTTFEEVANVVDMEIRNITQTEADLETDPLPEVDTKQHEHPDGFLDSKIHPGAVLNDRSLEVSLLVDYLKRLEQQQLVDPQSSVTHQIQLVQQTIMRLLKTQSDLFTSKHDHVENLAQELGEIHQEQKENPQQGAAKRIRRVRENLEQLG